MVRENSKLKKSFGDNSEDLDKNEIRVVLGHV